jgi:hypothetical protein
MQSAQSKINLILIIGSNRMLSGPTCLVKVSFCYFDHGWFRFKLILKPDGDWNPRHLPRTCLVTQSATSRQVRCENPFADVDCLICFLFFDLFGNAQNTPVRDLTPLTAFISPLGLTLGCTC